MNLAEKLNEDRAVKLKALRSEIGGLGGLYQKEVYPHPSLDVPLPKGAVIELVGPARYEFIADFIRSRSEPCLWMQKELSFFPTALLQRGVRMDRSVFVEAGGQVDWVLRQVLQSQVFPLVVGEDFGLGERDLRKVQLLAERSGSSFFHLCSDYRPSWVPMLSLHVEQQIAVTGDLQFSFQVLRRRGGL